MSVLSSFSGSPWADPKAWDSISIAGVTYGQYGPTSGQIARTIVGTQAVPVGNSLLPIGGKVRIRRASRHYRIDVKNPQGADGATETYRGIHPKAFEIIFSIWTASQYDYFVNTVLPAILVSGVKGTVTPVAVYHPSLANLGISVVFVEDIGAIEQVSDDLMFQCIVSVIEFLPPPPINTTSTPLGSKTVNPPSKPGVAPNPAITARLAIIANLNARAAADGLPAPFGKP